MKVLIVGYGSMGRRRIRLVSEVLNNAVFICVDRNPERLMHIKAIGLLGYSNLDEAINEKPEIAFVCTSPGHHASIILRLIDSGIQVFTELNLTSDLYEEIIDKSKIKNVSVFISSTLLYKKQIEFVNDFVKKQNSPMNYIYHVGQYLPDWHPWECYKDFFVSQKQTNGIREILAIQLPWIVNTFGMIDSLSCQTQKCTRLDIDFPDTVNLSLHHENGNIGVFVADVVSRKAITRLEIIGEKIHLFWDGYDDLYNLNIDSGMLEKIHVNNSGDHIEGYSDNINEEPYRNEIKEFLLMIKEGKSPRYSLMKDKYILSLIDKIEEYYQ